MFAGSSLAAIKTLAGLKSDSVVYHYTNNSGIVFFSISVGAGALIPYKRGDDDVGWFISYSHS